MQDVDQGVAWRSTAFLGPNLGGDPGQHPFRRTKKRILKGVRILFVQIAPRCRLQNVRRISGEKARCATEKESPYEPATDEDRSRRLRAMHDAVHRQLDEARLPALFQDWPDRQIQSR